MGLHGPVWETGQATADYSKEQNGVDTRRRRGAVCTRPGAASSPRLHQRCGRPGSMPLHPTDLAPDGEATVFHFRRHLPARLNPKDASDDDLIQVGLGRPRLFQPAGLPVPAWCAVVNPMGPDDPSIPVSERELSLAFEAYNNDASLVVVAGADWNQTARALWDAASADAADHAECGNGRAYALWQLPDGHLALGGFDNGGSDIAETSVATLARRLGTVVAEIHEAHFDPTPFLERGASADPRARAVNLVWASGASPAPGSNARSHELNNTLTRPGGN